MEFDLLQLATNLTESSTRMKFVGSDDYDGDVVNKTFSQFKKRFEMCAQAEEGDVGKGGDREFIHVHPTIYFFDLVCIAIFVVNGWSLCTNKAATLKVVTHGFSDLIERFKQSVIDRASNIGENGEAVLQKLIKSDASGIMIEDEDVLQNALTALVLFVNTFDPPQTGINVIKSLQGILEETNPRRDCGTFKTIDQKSFGTCFAISVLNVLASTLFRKRPGDFDEEFQALFSAIQAPEFDGCPRIDRSVYAGMLAIVKVHLKAKEYMRNYIRDQLFYSKNQPFLLKNQIEKEMEKSERSYHFQEEINNVQNEGGYTFAFAASLLFRIYEKNKSVLPALFTFSCPFDKVNVIQKRVKILINQYNRGKGKLKNLNDKPGPCVLYCDGGRKRRRVKTEFLDAMLTKAIEEFKESGVVLYGGAVSLYSVGGGHAIGWKSCADNKPIWMNSWGDYDVHNDLDAISKEYGVAGSVLFFFDWRKEV